MARKTKSRLRTRQHRFMPDGPLRRRISQTLPPIAETLASRTRAGEDTRETMEQSEFKEEFLLLLNRCHLFLRAVDSAASVAVQRANLEELLSLERPLTDRDYQELDGATKIRIGHHLPGGLISAETVELEDAGLRDAASRALESLGARVSGRPRNTDSLARAQFALGLASLFRQTTGRQPGRSYLVEPGLRSHSKEGGEQGQFLEFVELIVSALPKPLRQSVRAEQLARTGIKLFEQHPGGLIDEARFLS